MNKSKAFIGAALALCVTSAVKAQQPAAPQLPQSPNMTSLLPAQGPARVLISAASKVPISIVSNWRSAMVRAEKPGAPI